MKLHTCTDFHVMLVRLQVLQYAVKRYASVFIVYVVDLVMEIESVGPIAQAESDVRAARVLHHVLYGIREL